MLLLPKHIHPEDVFLDNDLLPLQNQQSVSLPCKLDKLFSKIRKSDLFNEF